MTFEQHLAKALYEHLRDKGHRIAKTIVPVGWCCSIYRQEALSRLQWENDERSRAMFLKAVK